MRILLFGDSISMGYRDLVKSGIGDFAEVIYPYENGKFAAYTYRMLFDWCEELGLYYKQIDYIYWNNGLWDVARLFEDEPQTPLEEYGDYIKRLCKRLKKLFPEAHICFGTTTPVLEVQYGKDFIRYNSDIIKYNNKAIEILSQFKDVEIDDLYSFTESWDEKAYKDATHFNNDAYKKISKHITKLILDYYSLHKDEFNKKEDSVKNEEQIINSIIKEKVPTVIWGAGTAGNHILRITDDVCNIVGIADKKAKEMEALVKGKIYMLPEEICNYAKYVIIAVMNQAIQEEMKSFCDENGIDCCLYTDIQEKILPLVEERRLPLLKESGSTKEYENKMAKYIGITIPAYSCNLKCEYCYLDESNSSKRGFPPLIHNIEYIGKSLSPERLGGRALIGLCGAGETLLADQFSDLCQVLVEIGHCVHIVTNGLTADVIKDILHKAGKYEKNVMFKFSFHYLQLKEKGLLHKFADNVNLVENSHASYTIELMPHDSLVPYIDEIKEFSLKHFGAYPHLTIGRDEHRDRRLLTEMSIDEYVNIWKVFDSKMFDMRMKLYMLKGKNCQAGEKAFYINLDSGQIDRCLFSESIGNLYLDDIPTHYKKVGDDCPLNYCYNCHVYAPIGLLPDVEVPTYMEIRDRTRPNGTHWLKEEMREFLDVKIR